MTEPHHPTLKASALLFACFAAMAAGMVELSLAAGYLAGSGTFPGGAARPAAGVATLAAGLGLMAWALMALHRNSLVLPRVVKPALAVAAAGHLLVLAVGPEAGSSTGISHLTALCLVLMALAGAGWLDRQKKTNDGGAHGQPRTGRLLAAAFGAAVVVASVATPGLAASMAGQYAVPHGEHGQAPQPGNQIQIPSHHH
ncbi:hypothetical protein ACPFL9_07490 [Paenarthrobacter sp. NyZ202]|uniref:hypothetical protein n=1 Tax=Paenarthrobacter sp. NyZ202 TaxID=3402689 RepID=UPI003CF827C7